MLHRIYISFNPIPECLQIEVSHSHLNDITMNKARILHLSILTLYG